MLILRLNTNPKVQKLVQDLLTHSSLTQERDMVPSANSKGNSDLIPHNLEPLENHFIVLKIILFTISTTIVNMESERRH